MQMAKKGLRQIVAWLLMGSLSMAIMGCGGEDPGPTAPAVEPGATAAAFEERVSAAGITLPPGFTATVFADNIGLARHIAVRDNGDVYVAIRRGRDGSAGGLVALRDVNDDGEAEIVERFGPPDVGTGIAIYQGQLYFSSNTAVYAVSLEDDKLVPSGEPVLIVGGFPEQRAHASKAITFDNNGHIYVNSGAPSNACQEEQRTAGSPGQMPCPQLERNGGTWRFAAAQAGQDQMDGTRYLTGTREVVALEWNPQVDKLYFAMHGRDQLDTLWPEYFTEDDRVELPAEEFHVAEQGDDFGWPYTHYDPIRGVRMVAPEYGGDGETAAEAGRYKDPLIGFPAHWGPNDLIFYDGESFPERYRGGAFIAFHGSWNRAPQPQGGYNVVFVPMHGGIPAGDWEVFADGFAGADPLDSPRNAAYRPTGLAVDGAGALLISDSLQGRIWRVAYAR
jgi:glucose/arabinose dehydrogenase